MNGLVAEMTRFLGIGDTVWIEGIIDKQRITLCLKVGVWIGGSDTDRRAEERVVAMIRNRNSVGTKNRIIRRKLNALRSRSGRNSGNMAIRAPDDRALVRGRRAQTTRPIYIHEVEGVVDSGESAIGRASVFRSSRIVREQEN